MDEIWERAVETALDGQTDVASVRTLTLDGAVKCVHGRLPPPAILEKFNNLQHLSIANIGVSSLEQFPHLQNLQKLILSDNRIAGGLEYLVEAGLESLRDLDLSNNRIQDINDLRPLAELKLVSLDLYECPVTRVKDYRSRVFGLIKSLKYLDKMDADENERPESDDEEDDDEEDEEEDPGSGEIDGDGEDRPYQLSNGHSVGNDGIVDVDEDEESDADEEETETSRGANGFSRPSSHHHSNGFRVAAVDVEDEGEEDEGEEDEDNDLVEEIDEDDGDDEDVVEVHEIDDSEDEEDGVEDDDDEDEDEDEEEVDNDEVDIAEPESTGRLTSTEGEIDDCDAGYLVQPVRQVEENAGASDMDPVNEDDDPEMEEEVDDEDDEVQVLPPSSSSQKRKRDGDDDDGDDNEEDNDAVEHTKSAKHQ
ncbi:hypothetical protein RJ640_011100 [Escallonia rubra]|uniref:Acidic leucine-rich nuclear phosphoprotein 32-related protein n=1 Tax=Escallonia rubra TaxID=112253 RepID=A0AA88UEI9_9ASTE|nr:hypothetical protein RJ640_011100 [Escallonia rubra]